MDFKHKLGYMFIGCLYTILVYILALLVGSATHAQKDEQVLDEIVCRKLRVVNAAGKNVARIEADEEGGNLIIINAAGKGVAVMAATIDGADIGVLNAAEKGVVRIAADEDGNGYIQTYEDGWRTH